MTFAEFEKSMSAYRAGRYLAACGGKKQKAIALYRLNLVLSQNAFSVIGCLEISLRNAIDECYLYHHGSDWLRTSVAIGGIFCLRPCQRTRIVIEKAIHQLQSHSPHPHHNQLVSKMDFGFWRYLLAAPQFNAAGQKLLQAFPAKPRSSPSHNINHTYIFRELELINQFRNRLAHHEPICFAPGLATIDSSNARSIHRLSHKLISWLGHDSRSLLYGIDHVESLCNKLDHFI